MTFAQRAEDAWLLLLISGLTVGALGGWAARGAWTRAGVHVRPVHSDTGIKGWRAYAGRAKHIIGLGNTATSKAEAERIAERARETL